MRWLATGVMALIGTFPLMAAQGEGPSFNREVRPVLAGNCYDCHGPDEEARKAKLRLDQPGAAAEVLKPDGELLRRITSTDPDEVMPPPEAKRTLKPEQIDLLRRWIEHGAAYDTHWAFVPPVRPEVPKVQNAAWVRNPIDPFILRRLEVEGLKPSPEADPYTLVRRVYLDLIGLPPSPEEADAFVNDPDPRAYERLVDALLASEEYGVRWARPWLDLARYSDTNGYEKDRPRSIWPYRDWVVDSLNADMPFDEFTIQQIAGDMLPGAGVSERIATGFHRNTMLNEEGGIDPLEFRYYAMVDRVATTGTVWLGLTTGCAQCHTHKYDPITHTDYYRLMALLNNADEPDLDVVTAEVRQERAAVEAKIAAREAVALGEIDEMKFWPWVDGLRARGVHWLVARPEKATSNLPRLEVLEDGSVLASGDFTKRDVYRVAIPSSALPEAPVTSIRLEVLPHDSLPAHGPGAAYYEGRRGDFFLSEITAKSGGQTLEFSGASHSFGKISVGSGSADAANVIDGKGSTGWATATREGESHHLVLNLAGPVRLDQGLDVEMLFERHFVAGLGRFRFSVTTDEQPAAALASGAPDPFAVDETALRRHYLHTAPEMAEARKSIEALSRQLPEVPTTLVMRERPADHTRETHRHHRGEFLSAREEVSPGVPAVFRGLPEDRDANRLTFARWLVSERNPLVARVTVNRAWQAVFGRGLVVSADDFGTQAPAPSHPELLDWLATEFVRQRWSMKKLHRMLALSATYRQDSAVSPELLRRDPQNEWLARGPRFRVPAEMVRDLGLKASGLLSLKRGGPGVYPPQPDSVTDLAYGNTKWNESKGTDRYRRSLYTFSKRTAPFAAYTVFDAPSGETCVARRDRSNTPLQSLNLLNDEMFLEMARALAGRAMSETEDVEARARYVFRQLLTRPPQEEEMRRLVAYYQDQRERLAAGQLDAAKLLGEKSGDAERASWMLVARALMNIDETITKE